MINKAIRISSAFATVGLCQAFSSYKIIHTSHCTNLFSTTDPIKNIADLRKEYSRKGLIETEVEDDPMTQFKIWFTDACQSNILEPNAMCLSTSENNRPSARIVLLKDFDSRGFVWYTNYSSRKGNELERNPYAALTFWWGDLERSVRIEGEVEKVSEAQSDEYFNSRPRGSRIGAWTSDQSRPINNRDALELQENEIVAKYKDTDNIPRPQHWGGYRLKPNRIEFWKGRESRLHDRIVYVKTDNDSWEITRLQP